MSSDRRSLKDEDILFYFLLQALLSLLKSGCAMTFENVIATDTIIDAFFCGSQQT